MLFPLDVSIIQWQALKTIRLLNTSIFPFRIALTFISYLLRPLFWRCHLGCSQKSKLQFLSLKLPQHERDRCSHTVVCQMHLIWSGSSIVTLAFIENEWLVLELASNLFVLELPSFNRSDQISICVGYIWSGALGRLVEFCSYRYSL